MMNETCGKNPGTETDSRPGVIVVGGTGYVGAALCQFLSDRGHQVTAASRSALPMIDDLDIAHVRFDVMAPSANVLPPEVSVAVICPWVHLAQGPTAVPWVDRVMPMLVDSGTRTVIYLSTMWVYGDSPVGLLTESMQHLPTSAYGMTHADNELSVRVGATSLGADVSILRMANLVGPDPFFRFRQKTAFAHEFMEMAVWNRRIVLRSPPSTPRNMLPRTLFHHDVGSLLDRPRVEGRVEVFNLGSCSTSSVLDMAVQISQIAENYHGHGVGIEYPDESTPQPTFHLDTTRIRSLAGPAPDDLEAELSMILEDVCASRDETRAEGRQL